VSKIHIIYTKGKIYTVRENEKQSKISHSQKKVHANFEIENTYKINIDAYQPKL
jgi:hypothetical protein